VIILLGFLAIICTLLGLIAANYGDNRTFSIAFVFMAISLIIILVIGSDKVDRLKEAAHLREVQR
jgi:uncharacterized membrane protein YfcA